MAFEFGYSDLTGDNFEVYIKSIGDEAGEISNEMLELASEEVKEFVIANLNKHRRVLSARYKDRPAMADDVKINTRTDKYGDKYIKVQGGKKTGTLWHLVNDGNLHSQPTHFMDGALARLDGNINKLWDDILGGKK